VCYDDIGPLVNQPPKIVRKEDEIFCAGYNPFGLSGCGEIEYKETRHPFTRAKILE
jgi:hypothetical protein